MTTRPTDTQGAGAMTDHDRDLYILDAAVGKGWQACPDCAGAGCDECSYTGEVMARARDQWELPAVGEA